MYIRTKVWKKSTSVQIVESRREWTKVKQKVLKYIWCKENWDRLWIKDLIKSAEYIKYELENEIQTSLIPFNDAEIELEQENKETNKKELEEMKKEIKVNIKNIEEESRIIKGIHDIYWHMYEQLWFETIFWTKQKTSNYAKVLKDIVLARIWWPKSKRASVEMLDSDYGIRINLQEVYDMMWKIDEEKINKIQDISFNYTKTILNEKINVLFMDWTTLYFESQKEDELREKWYSKDWKFSETQVALTLLVTESWLPIWYKLYNWSHYEWNSLKDLVEEIETKYEINRIVLVADSWFLNEENTKYLNDRWNKYILWARIKSLPKKKQEEILDKTKYIITKKDELWNMLEWYIETEYKERRLIVKYSKKRAEKDKKDREKNIEKLKKKEWKELKEMVSNFWYKKYLKQEWEAIIWLDETKIRKAELWDWLHWVLTNDDELTSKEIWKYYRWLWQVEESFRINKHDLRIRPIYHWNQQKIRAHVAIAFMSFSLVRHLEYRLELNWYNYSPEVIRKELLRVQWSVILDKTNPKEKYFLPSNISETARNIYKVIGKKWDRTVQKIINTYKKSNKKM
jgi:transposase